MDSSTIGLCFYLPEEMATYSVAEALMKLCQLSRTQLKRSGISKKILEATASEKKAYYFPIDLINYNLITGDYEGPEIQIVFEDQDFLVLNKPPFIHGHPLKYSDRKNCLSYIRQTKGRERLLEVNKKEHERGLLYRLDLETSGVLVYVKNDKLLQELRGNFSTQVVEKTYLAIVTGELKRPTKLTHHLVPTGPKGHKMKALISSENEQLANLEVAPLDYRKDVDLSLVKVTLHEGLRHQIRCQLAAVGHPLLGDSLYGGKTERRIYLHAFQYKLRVKGNDRSFLAREAPLFGDFFDFHRSL